MNRNILRKIHLTAAASGFLLILCFWTTTLLGELFLSLNAVAAIKKIIFYLMFLMPVSMAAAGITGIKMGGKSKHPKIAAKRKRMPVIALNGLLVLIPCAVFLHLKASAGVFDGAFYSVQVLELVAGAVNLILMGLSMKDGMSIRKPKQKVA